MIHHKKLGLVEAVGLSVSILAPTLAMSFNTIFAVQAAGAAATLSFLIGTLAMLLVGLCFVMLARRVHGDGSVYAYIGHTFGRRSGLAAGWALLLCYGAVFATSTALFGNAMAVLLGQFGIRWPQTWFLLATSVTLSAAWMTRNDTKIASRVMLMLEGISILVLLTLAVQIFLKAPLSSAAFHPDRVHGWSGIGAGMVFAALSFGGFEGAVSISQETSNPRRNVPIALLSTLIFGGIFYLIVVYAQIIGYGVNNLSALTNSNSPLNSLAQQYISRPYAICVDLSIVCSTFACVLGSLTAASRTLRTITLRDKTSWMTDLDSRHQTPSHAILLISTLSLATIVPLGIRVGAVAFAGAMATIGTLAILVVYIGVTSAAMVEAFRAKRWLWVSVGLMGSLLLLWPLWNNLYPVPPYPANLWPYAVLIWIFGAIIYKWKDRTERDSPSGD